MTISKADGPSFSGCPLECIARVTEEEEMKKKCESCLLRMIQYLLYTFNKSKGQWYWLHCLWPRLTLSWILHLIGFLHGIDHDSYEACYWDSLLPIPTCLQHSQLTRMCLCSSAIFFSFFFFFSLTSALHTISRGIRWYLRQRIGLTGQHVMTAWS